MKKVALLLVLALAVGCAGSRIKPVGATGAEDPAPLVRALESYNAEGGNFRALGEARAKGAPPVAYGARSSAGRAVRMDGVAFPAMKLLFSASCPPENGCEVYFPDDFVVYREDGKGFGPWLSMLAVGRVPVIGVPVVAGKDASGASVLRFSDARGQWMEVVFAADDKQPARAVYGEKGGGPLLELVFSDYREEGGVAWPGEVLVGGESSGDEFVLAIERVERTGEIPHEAFELRLPRGVREIDKVGRDTWKRLGMYWIPKY